MLWRKVRVLIGLRVTFVEKLPGTPCDISRASQNPDQIRKRLGHRWHDPPVDDPVVVRARVAEFFPECFGFVALLVKIVASLPDLLQDRRVAVGLSQRLRPRSYRPERPRAESCHDAIKPVENLCPEAWVLVQHRGCFLPVLRVLRIKSAVGNRLLKRSAEGLHVVASDQRIDRGFADGCLCGFLNSRGKVGICLDRFQLSLESHRATGAGVLLECGSNRSGKFVVEFTACGGVAGFLLGPELVHRLLLGISIRHFRNRGFALGNFRVDRVELVRNRCKVGIRPHLVALPADFLLLLLLAGGDSGVEVLGLGIDGTHRGVGLVPLGGKCLPFGVELVEAVATHSPGCLGGDRVQSGLDFVPAGVHLGGTLLQAGSFLLDRGLRLVLGQLGNRCLLFLPALREHRGGATVLQCLVLQCEVVGFFFECLALVVVGN